MRDATGKNSAKKTAAKGECYQGPFRVAACWPHQEAPLILVMYGDGKTAIATSMTPISLESLLDLSVNDLADPDCDPACAADLPRWIFALPYEKFAQDRDSTDRERPIAWNIKAALVWNDQKAEPRYVARPDAKSSRFHLDPSRELKSLLSDAQKWVPFEPNAIDLLPLTSDESYLDHVRSIISSIQNGDFYQVNLLRYFQAPKAGGWENLCMRLEKYSGPHGCILTQGSRVIASFSPERFIEIPAGKTFKKIVTWPIKGTIARVQNSPDADEIAGQNLLSNEKDRAELRMIIDLMRNDLTRICIPGSVNVLSGGNLKKFSSVWHLEGEIEGNLKENLKVREVLESVCPGGSVTGAPKLAAMQRIKSDEGQPRGFFMGNLFIVMHDGALKSNILIRTLLSDNWMRTARYAAGSGLVVKSSPEIELQEIKSKCAVLTGLNL